MEKGLSLRLKSEAEARGLDADRLLKKFGVSSGSGNGGDYLIIPYRRGGELKNRKYRTSLVPGEGGGKAWQDSAEKGATRMLYNEDVLRDPALKGKPVIITEGEPDLWAVDLAGYERVVGWPDGAPEVSIPLDVESPKYKPLEDAKALFHPDNLGGPDVPIIIAADGDSAGAVLLHDLSIRLGRARCKFLTYPLLPTAAYQERGRQRCKDLGEVLEFYGPHGVVRTIEKAEWVAADGVYRMSQLAPRPNPRVFEIDMPMLCDSYRMRLGDWSVVTGIPSFGKTTLVNDIVNRVIQRYSTRDDPVVVTWGSFEQEPQIDHRRNLRWWFHSKHPAKQTPEEREVADAWIDRHHRFLVAPEDEDITVDWALERLATAVVRENSRIVVLDPWNEMDHSRLPGESVTDYTGRAIKAMRRFCRSLGVHLIVVAHPTKMQPRADGSIPMPTLYSVSDSAHWYNKCDVGIIVHREANNTVIWVQKTRYHDEIGRPGMYDATYHAGERRFDIIGHHEGH
jgi:twinkle protein